MVVTSRSILGRLKTIAAKFYGEVASVDEAYVKVRVDDQLHPDFWLEVVIPVAVLRDWKLKTA